MILDIKPVSLAEVKNIIWNLEDKEAIQDYLKKYGKLSLDKASELRNELFALSNLKIKEESVTKTIDFLPKDVEDVNKIFNDVSLNEEEINAIIEIVKKY